MKAEHYPWHDSAWQQITDQYGRASLPHAFLFNGIKGIGKADFVSRLAAWLMCSGEKSPTKACGACKQCRLFESESQGDYRFIEPEEGSQVIKVDAIRSLNEFISQSANQGGLKIAVLYPAESLNINAANALLKTLEEPSQNSLIILISHVSGQLLPTIRSRCQVVDFIKPSESQALDWMCSNLELGREDATQLLPLCAGGPLQAEALLEFNAVEEHTLMLSELGKILKRDVSPSGVAERWADELASLRLSWMTSWLQWLTKSKLDGESAALEGKGAERMFVYIRDKASMRNLFDLYDESLVQYRLLNGTSNPNKTLLFEHLFHQWINLIRN